MSQNELRELIKLTNFKRYANEALDNPTNTLDLLCKIADDYKTCIEYQATLYDGGCFNKPELMKEYYAIDVQMGLYRLILAELPKYL